MRIKYLFPLMASLILILSSTLKGDEFVTGPSYVEGPLSFFRKGEEYPIISIRDEMDYESFKLFYKFCQLAFNASLQDIDSCVDYLPQASAKEKSLILTTFYVYAYPWEKQKQITNKIIATTGIKSKKTSDIFKFIVKAIISENASINGALTAPLIII